MLGQTTSIYNADGSYNSNFYGEDPVSAQPVAYGPPAPGQQLPGWPAWSVRSVGTTSGICNMGGHNICLYAGIAVVGFVAMAMLSKKGKSKSRKGRRR